MTESDELVGKMSPVSRLPQYLDGSQRDVLYGLDPTNLMQAMLIGAETVTWKGLDTVVVAINQSWLGAPSVT